MNRSGSAPAGIVSRRSPSPRARPRDPRARRARRRPGCRRRRPAASPAGRPVPSCPWPVSSRTDVAPGLVGLPAGDEAGVVLVRRHDRGDLSGSEGSLVEAGPRRSGRRSKRSGSGKSGAVKPIRTTRSARDPSGCSFSSPSGRPSMKRRTRPVCVLVGQDDLVPVAVIDPAPRLDGADPADVEDEPAVADEERLPSGTQLSPGAVSAEEAPAATGLEPRGDRVIAAGQVEVPGLRDLDVGAPVEPDRRGLAGRDRGRTPVLARGRRPRPSAPSPDPSVRSRAPGRGRPARPSASVAGPRLNVRLKAGDAAPDLDPRHLQHVRLADGVGEDDLVAVAVLAPVMGPRAGQGAVRPAVAAAGPRVVERPVAGFAQPGPAGLANSTRPATLGWTSCRPLKLIPFQSMNPAPVHAAASRSVSWSKTAHARPRETPPGPGVEPDGDPLVGEVGRRRRRPRRSAVRLGP